jgi:hypothetical protein
MLTDPGTDHLSDYDVKSLIKIADRYRDWEDYDLSELTHTFDEYKRNWDGKHKSAPISKSDLLRGIGYMPDEIKVALDEADLYAVEHVSLGCR